MLKQAFGVPKAELSLRFVPLVNLARGMNFVIDVNPLVYV